MESSDPARRPEPSYTVAELTVKCRLAAAAGAQPCDRRGVEFDAGRSGEQIRLQRSQGPGVPVEALLGGVDAGRTPLAPAGPLGGHLPLPGAEGLLVAFAVESLVLRAVAGFPAGIEGPGGGTLGRKELLRAAASSCSALRRESIRVVILRWRRRQASRASRRAAACCSIAARSIARRRSESGRQRR